jgi:hypothetical protein
MLRRVRVKGALRKDNSGWSQGFHGLCRFLQAPPAGGDDKPVNFLSNS